jgi:SAM-dependent methyltransferase
MATDKASGEFAGRCYCGANLVAAGFTSHGVQILACRSCGYWRTPRPADTDSRILHEGEHPSASQGQAGERFPSLIAQVRQACADFRAREAFGKSDTGTALDFGSGQGFYLGALKRLGYEAMGVEISEATAMRAIRAGHKVGTRLDQLPAGRFDALVSIHVIEHIDDPHAVLLDVTGRLNPGARFLFEVPNAAGWQGRLFGERWLHRESSLHVHHFSPGAFKALLGAHRFQVERESCYSFEHGLLGWIQSLYNLIFPYNRFFRRIVLNSSLRERLTAWPEVLLFPIFLVVGGLLFLAEAAAGSGPVIRVSGRYAPPALNEGGEARA